VNLHGTCDPAFAAVRDAFEDNFARRGEVGASVCIQAQTLSGPKTVVDLWGGTCADGQTPWTEETVSIVFSCTKAAVALCAHILIDQGKLDPDAKVTTIWPEFGAAGKEDTTIRDMLAHRSGVPALRNPLKAGAYLDFDYMTEQLAAEAPWWNPGTDHGYHLVSFGWTVGELVRRAAAGSLGGQSLGAFFREAVAGPLGLDFHIGLPDAALPRVSKLIPPTPDPTATPSPFVAAMFADPDGLQAKAYFNNGGWNFDAPESYAAEIGGAGGIANARALAGMFAALLPRDGLISATRRHAMAQPVSEGLDRTLRIPTRFGEGFMLSMDNADQYGEGASAKLGDAAFGHVGMGGSLGFVDPEAGLAFGYTMNRMGDGILLNARGQSLVDAAYGCL